MFDLSLSSLWVLLSLTGKTFTLFPKSALNKKHGPQKNCCLTTKWPVAKALQVETGKYAAVGAYVD